MISKLIFFGKRIVAASFLSEERYSGKPGHVMDDATPRQKRRIIRAIVLEMFSNFWSWDLEEIAKIFVLSCKSADILQCVDYQYIEK
jgi:hypothetical protein